MKRKIVQSLLILTAITILIALTSCLDNSKIEPQKYSEGLEFTLNEAGTGYILSGKGDCEDYEVTVPDIYNGLPVVEVGEKAFYEGRGIQSIVLPDTVAKISNWSFAYSTIAEIYIPGSVKVIESYAFHHCNYLQILEIENGLEIIEEGAFFSCTNLRKVKLPSSVKDIGYIAFRKMLKLEAFEVDEDNEYFSSIDGNLYANNGKNLLYYARAKEEREFQIPYGTEEIGAYAFEDATLNVIIIPETVGVINQWAFAGNHCLESLTLPKSVNIIGQEILIGCYNFTTLYYQGTHNEWGLIQKAGYPNNWNKGMPKYRFDCFDAYFDCVPGESSIVNWK